MPGRFINCSACRGCHTGRGGKFCAFVSPGGSVIKSPDSKMASADIPDSDDPRYESYLADRIAEEEDRLTMLKDKCRLTAMEQQLASLRLQTTELSVKSDLHMDPEPDTGVASQLLSAVTRGAAGGSVSYPRSPRTPTTRSPFTPQCPKEEKEFLSKLQALSYMPEPKPVEKITYRDFICAMTKVLKTLTDLEIDPSRYAAHMSCIASKAALNLYATDALIKYEAAVTEKVITGHYIDWVAAAPECVALHLGADATYAVRQGGSSRWSCQTSTSFGQGRDFSDWPKEICWLYNNTSCTKFGQITRGPFLMTTW